MKRRPPKTSLPRRRSTLVTTSASRRFEEFPIDVSFSDPLGWRPDRLPGTDLLAFAGIEQTELPVLPLEQHVAEKLHAYTRTYGAERSPSSRPKDLIDIVLVKAGSTLDGGALRAALEVTFTARGLQPLPATVPKPPPEWDVPYARLAEAVGLPTDVGSGYRDAAALLDPILAGGASGRWDPEAGTWAQVPTTPAATPKLLAPKSDEIVIGELQNVASDIQPIRVRTIYVPIRNSGDGQATFEGAEASSTGHGPLTARPPRSIEPNDSGTLELTLAAPADQTIAPGDRFDIELRYRGEDTSPRQFEFSARFDAPGRWEVEVKAP